jgi:alpha-amylase
MIRLLWVIHNHQPVGNFDFIFERAYERAYRPFLNVLKLHPRIRLSLHFSGILLDWLEKNHPEHLRDLRGLCESGQIEILGGAYYEPILSMLSDGDKEGQILKLSRRVESLFGTAPRGIWLAERVWEPSMAAPIARCGIEYTVLDGNHFKMAGKTDAGLDGHFETEDQGFRLKLFPIHDGVRDTIPFREVAEVIANLRRLDTAPEVQIVFGDDGEKFGDWPQTYETVYTQGWLDRFFSAVEAEPESFAMLPLRDGLGNGKNLGLVYLPPASYQEMMVWAQNAEDVPRFRDLRRWLQESGREGDAEHFLRGVFWRNFLTRYPESNRMHKQGLRLSRTLESVQSLLPGEAVESIRDHLWQSQCNCAYWHGVFGGLYLPHLRFALYRQLIAAQKLMDPVLLAGASHAWEASDWNFDGQDEYLLNTRRFLISFTAGGAVDQFWLKRTGINLCDTLTRRREAYHEFIVSGARGGAKLEDQIRAKEEGLVNFLTYDRRIRESFSEWLLPSQTPFEDYRYQRFSPLAELRFGKAECLPGVKGVKVRFEGAASLPDGGSLRVEKTYLIPFTERAIEIIWRFHCQKEAVDFRFAAEILFCLLAGNAPDRYVSWGKNGRDILSSSVEMPGVQKIGITDEWLGLRGKVEARKASTLWRDAIETISQSEGGYERVYQGTVLAPVWDVHIPTGGDFEACLRVDLQEDNDGW